MFLNADEVPMLGRISATNNTVEVWYQYLCMAVGSIELYSAVP
jgi:hypothetical protein